MNKIFLIFTLLAAFHTNAQNMVISGIIKDAETKEPLSFCNILLLNSSIGASADFEGYFALHIPKRVDNPKLVISNSGYKADTILITEIISGLVFYLKPIRNILDEIVVTTGVSRATLVKEIPVSITSVSVKNIDNTIESNPIDMLVKNVAGLNAVKTGPNISKPFIRGLGYNRVLILYDGIRQEGQQWGDEHGIEVDGYNINKAEVIKGPASLMFGSDALAGVVSMFPYIPKDEDGIIRGKFISEYQGNNGLAGNGISLNFSNQRWIFALRGSYRLAKNHSNKIDGRVYNTGFQEKNLSGLIGYNSEKGHTHFNVTLYDNLQGIPDGSRDSLTRKFTKQVNEANLDEIKQRPLVSDAELNYYALGPLHQHIQHYRIYSNSHYQLRYGEIDATIAFQQNVRREYNHPTMPLQPGLFVRLNTINYGIKYLLPKFKKIETTIGLNGMSQNNKSKSATDFPIPDYNLFDIGVYVYGKWKKNKLTLSGGLRHDLRFLNGNNFYVKTNPLNGFGYQVFLPDTANANLQFAAINKRFDGLSFSIGGTYSLTSQIYIKANIARGYRSPGITELASNGLDPGAHIIYLGNRNFAPEFSFQKDLEIAGDFRNVSTSISIFHNQIQNFIYLAQLADAGGNPIVDAQSNKTFQYEQSSAELYGTEISLNIYPQHLNGFNFNNNFELVYGFNKKNEFKNKGTGGEYLPLIPPAKIVSAISKQFNISPGPISSINTKAEIEYHASQNRFLALYDTETKSAGYTLLNLSAGIDLKYNKKQTLKFQAQANNLFDIAYQSNLSRLKYLEYYENSSQEHSGIYGMGRNICFKIIATF